MGKFNSMVKKYGMLLIIGVMAAIIIILTFRSCQPDGPEVVTIIERDTIKGDSVPYEVLLPKPFPVYKDTGSTKWKYKEVDTCSILRDYYSQYYYQDTLKNDTSALVVVNDVVTENKLQARKLIFQNRRATVINTTINNYGETPCSKLYIGAGLGKSIPNFLTDSVIRMPVALLFTTKGRWAYELEYDIFTNYVEAKVFYKLNFRKKR